MSLSRNRARCCGADGFLRAGLLQIVHFLARHLPAGRFRPFFYKAMGIKIEGKVVIEGDVWIDEVAPEMVILENDVTIAPKVTIIAHQGSSRTLRDFYPFMKKPVVIKKGAWICAGATILPGVTIGEGAVVGAGAVVTANVASYTVVAGIPAKPIRKLRPEKNRSKL